MTQPVGTKVDPHDLGDLGGQLDKAAATLSEALGDPRRWTDLPLGAFGPADDVAAQYLELADELAERVRVVTTHLTNGGTTLRNAQQHFLDIEATNRQRVARAHRGHR